MKPFACCFFGILGLVQHVLGQGALLPVSQPAKEDTATVNELQREAETYLNKDNKKAAALFQSALTKSEKLNYIKGLALSYRKLGYVNGQEGRYQQAIDQYRIALQYYGKMQSVMDVVTCYNNIGTNYWQLGKTDSTMHYYLQGIKTLENAAHKNETFEKKQVRLSDLALLNQNVGIIYGNLENFEKAHYYGSRAILLAREAKDTSKWVQSLAALSHAYEVTADFPKMLRLSREAVSLASAANLIIPLSKSYHLLSTAYLGLNKLDSAIFAAAQCRRLSEKTDAQLYISSLIDLAGAYDKQKNYAAEVQMLKLALAKHKTATSIGTGDDIYEKLAKATYNLGLYKEAYDYYTLSRIYRDSIFNIGSQASVNELEIKYQTAQKEKQLSEKQLQLIRKDLLLQQNKQYVFFSIGAAIIAFFMATLIFFHYRSRRRLHKQQYLAMQQEKENQLLQAVLQGEEKERNRIAKDLHDGVAGTLAAAKMHMSSLCIKHAQLQDEKEFNQGILLLDDATHQVRTTSHNLMPEVLIRYGLPAAVEKFCNNISNGFLLQVKYESYGVISRYISNFELSVYRIVQELLNNIIKHSKATEATVQVTEKDNTLFVFIEDNGIGFHNAFKQDGMGLQSVRSRVEAMNGTIDIHTQDKEGVAVYIEIDIHDYKV